LIFQKFLFLTKHNVGHLFLFRHPIFSTLYMSLISIKFYPIFALSYTLLIYI